MSEMESCENESDCANELLLLDRVLLRLGNVDTDEQLESCLGRFLPPVILKLSSPHEQVRTKVMELLVHVNKRVKCRSEVQLPVKTLLENYKDPKANSFIINFSIIYITMGFPRLPKEQQLALAPTLLESIENKPQAHQDGILMLIMPLLGDIKEEDLNLKEKPKLSGAIVKFATDILLLPYRALPSNAEEREEFQVPPGMSMKSYKRIVEKNVINANQLEEMKLSIVNFISKDFFKDSDVLLPLIVAAADSRFSIANNANSPLIRVSNSVDWSAPSVVGPLYSLYMGTPTNAKVPTNDRKMAACTRLRLKLIQYLNKATGSGILFPHCVQIVFFSLFDTNSNTRLKTLALGFLLNVIQNGDEVQLKRVATVFLQGLLKVIRSDECSEHHPKAYLCLGRLATKCPDCIDNKFSLLEELVKKVPEAAPERKTSLRDAILEMACAYKVESKDAAEAMDTSNSLQKPGTSSMEVDNTVESKKPNNVEPIGEPQALAMFALLDNYIQSEDNMIRYIAMRYASVVFPADYIPSRYLLLLASGDSQDDISNEAKKGLYGTFRTTEIEDVINNVNNKDNNAADLDHSDSASGKNKQQDVVTFKAPHFENVLNYIWEQMQRRKEGSNTKHRFVVNNQVLPFHPLTYQEMLRYLRMCLNYEAKLENCSNHPNATSPILTKFIVTNLVDTDVLDRYLTMIVALLNASPELMPLTCFLDIVGCVPEKMSAKYTTMLPFLKNLFITSTKEDVRETSALIYAIIKVNTSEKSALDSEITEFVSESASNKNLEAQCGYMSTFTNMCERCINLSRKGKQFGGKGFVPANWAPYKAAAENLAKFLSSPQPMLVSTACTNIALLVRTNSLPFPNSTPEVEERVSSENPFEIGKTNVEETDMPVSKFFIVDKLFKIVHNAKLSSKIKEKALFNLGIVCCGERFPYARHIIGGFLLMAKETKEFEIHLQIGESLVMCVEGVNSNENRDLWTKMPEKGAAKVKNAQALEENDEILNWLLDELCKLGRMTHPHSRQATSIWLLALLKNCSDREPVQKKLQTLQDMFMDFLSENSEIVQDVASKGLSLVYQSSDENRQKELVAQLIDQLTSGKRAVAQVTEDTKIFEEGQLGKAPTGGNLSTYKELCSLASDLNQPDLLYKFMHLAHHNSVWNSKKGAAFGFHSIAVQAGAQLSEHLPKIVPRLYRYRFDPTPRIQNSMSSIWHALVPETQKTVQKYHKEILDDLVANLTSNQWRVRMSCCNALADLLRGAQSLHDSLEQLPTLWSQLFRVMDDVHEGTRQAATTTANVLSKLCIRASDANQDKDGKKIVSAILPVLLDNGITNVVREVRNVSLLTVSKLVSAAGDNLKPFLQNLIPALVTAAGDLESAKLSHLSTMLGTDTGTREVLDDIRANATRQHYTTDTVVKCMPFIDIKVMTDMLPKMLELTKSPQLGTKVACCHFFILATHHLRLELEPIAGKIMSNLLNGAFDRNLTVRKNYAEALGQISACAKSSSIEKLMKKLIALNESKDDEISRSAIGLILKAIAKAKLEMIKDNEVVIAPMVFLAMHASKDEEAATVEMYEEIWMDISPGREIGIREHLGPISRYLEEALNSRSWTKKIQAANAIKTMCKELSRGLGKEREQLLRALLAAAHGKTFDGKQHVLDALAEICTVKDGEAPISASMAEESINALLVECGKQEPVYKKHAITALGKALAALHTDRFQQVYDIVKVILLKDESTIEKDSDEEDNEGARQRRLQLLSLKESAYELLGNAWPREYQTQQKYQEVFFEHCSRSYPNSVRSAQLCILTAMSKVLEKLVVLNDVAMDVDNVDDNRDSVVRVVTAHVADIVEYTLENINQVRHKRDALNLMDILVKRLKGLNNEKDLEKLRNIYQSHVADLSKDSSYEIRAKIDNIKTYFK